MRTAAFVAFLLAASASAQLPTLLERTGDGAEAHTGLAAVMAAGKTPRWPVELAGSKGALTCAISACTPWDQLETALNRAAAWMAAFPTDQLKFDAAIGLAMIRQSVDSAALRTAFEHARATADRDRDHPQRRFWVPGLTAPPEHTSRWVVPADGTRVNSNRVIDEALHCASNGWRPETMRYVCGAMRDGGGYQTTHALWALDIARRNGCLAADAFLPCATTLQHELRAQQPPALAPKATLDIDLFAERLLMLVLTGDPDPMVDQWARALVGQQNADGSWGITANESPYYRYHATNAATWALAEWFRRSAGHSPAPAR